MSSYRPYSVLYYFIYLPVLWNFVLYFTVIDVHCISQDMLSYAVLTDVPWSLLTCHNTGLLLTQLTLAVFHLWLWHQDSKPLVLEEDRKGRRTLALHGLILGMTHAIFIGHKLLHGTKLKLKGGRGGVIIISATLLVLLICAPCVFF